MAAHQPHADHARQAEQLLRKNNQGELLPLSTLITLTDRARPRQLNQFQQLNSALISGFPMVSMGEAIDTVRQITLEETPPGYAFDYSGASRQWHSAWCR